MTTKTRLPWKLVDSSNVDALAFEATHSIELQRTRAADVYREVGDVYVSYHDGVVWRYRAVLFDTYLEILKAPSVGKAVHALLIRREAEKVGDFQSEAV